MSEPEFGKTLFSGSPFLRWALGPILAISGIIAACFAVGAMPKGDLPAIVLLVAIAIGCLSLAAGLFFPKWGWPFRVVTGIVFLGYLAYVVDEWGGDRENGYGWQSRRSETNPRNALLGFLIIGLPCLWFTIVGRFSVRRDPEESIGGSAPDSKDSRDDEEV